MGEKGDVCTYTLSHWNTSENPRMRQSFPILRQTFQACAQSGNTPSPMRINPSAPRFYSYFTPHVFSYARAFPP